MALEDSKQKKIKMSETAAGTVYEFEIEKEEIDMVIVIDASGKVTRQEMKKIKIRLSFLG